jgi:saccharopine dehydrogenase-like NADP-dependent oxidoreductase
MKSVLVLGAGKVGKAVAELLLACGGAAGAGSGGRGGEGARYRVTIADRDDAALHEAVGNLARVKAQSSPGAEYTARKVDVGDPAAVKGLLTGHDYVICMLPFDSVAGIAEAANTAGVHYFDVTEDVKATEQVKAIHAQGRAKVAIVPQCGLAPGYIAIAAYDVARGFSELHELKLRVGALPQFPTNALKYNITWSAAGVVNEYCEPCNVMLGGKMVRVPALEGLENFSFEGVEYEAFYTSGGVGSLIETLTAEKRTNGETTVAYKTIRYPGHCALMKFMLQDMRLGSDDAGPSRRGTVFNRALTVDLLEHAIPRTVQDVVVIFINCIGIKDGRREQVNLRRVVRARDLFGRVWPAIELTTAAGVCAMVDLHRMGKLRQTGFIRQEECTLAMLAQTPFGLVFEDPEKVESGLLGRA